MRDAVKILGATVAAVICGAVYVVVHEERRKYKKLHPKAEPAPATEPANKGAGSSQPAEESCPIVSVISKEALIATLNEIATAAYSLIEQARSAVTTPGRHALTRPLPAPPSRRGARFTTCRRRRA